MRLNGITMKQIRFRNGESKNINDGSHTNEARKKSLGIIFSGEFLWIRCFDSDENKMGTKFSVYSIESNTKNTI